jgi:hypothetical protein
MNAFATTTEIARVSLRVLSRNRQLLWFPVLSLATALGLVITFAPWLPEPSAAGGIAIACLYFALVLSSAFFDAALTRGALSALRQQPATVTDGLTCASSRGRALVEYAGIEATVGLLLGALSRDDRRSSFAQFVLGTAWSAATYLAMPVLVAERRGGYDSMRRAGRLFRQTWGETSLAELGFRIATANLLLLCVAILVLLLHWLDEAAAILLFAALALAVAVVVTSVQAIYRAALYIFAAEGVLPTDFDTPEMSDIWRVK